MGSQFLHQLLESFPLQPFLHGALLGLLPRPLCLLALPLGLLLVPLHLLPPLLRSLPGGNLRLELSAL